MPKAVDLNTRPPQEHPYQGETPLEPSAPLLGIKGRPWGICGVGADPTTDQDAIPGRFLRGLPDEAQARARWQKTKKWRSDEGIDYLLDEPHPGFFQFKKNYPHYYHKQSKRGEYLYVERCGQGHVENLWAMGFDIKQLARHYCFTSEFMWRMVNRDDDAMIISIFDLKGTTMNQLRGSQLQLFRECSLLVGDHYPERSRMTFVINAPWWITAAFAIIKPFMDPRTFEKIKVLGSDYKEYLLKHFDPENLPVELGGTDTDKLGEAPVERQMNELILKINQRWAGCPTSIDDPVDKDGFKAFLVPFVIPEDWKMVRKNEATPGLRDPTTPNPCPETKLEEEAETTMEPSLTAENASIPDQVQSLGSSNDVELHPSP